METTGRRPWTIDPDLGVLEVDPDEALPAVPLKKVPAGDIYEAARAGDVDRLCYLIESGVNVNARDQWDSVSLYYACLAGHAEAARMLLRAGAICSVRTFDGDRCHYAALNLRIRRLLKAFEARPPPMAPLQAALRDTFLGCPANRAYLEQCDAAGVGAGIAGYSATDDRSDFNSFPPDITFYVDGRPLEAHRLILSARSPFFKIKFETEWKDRSEVRFARGKLSYPAFYSLVHFFYSDRLDVAVDDMDDLVRLCKACKCDELQRVIEIELRHQKNAEYKALKDVDNSQKRFILQGLSLPEQDRLPSAMHRVLQASLANSSTEDMGPDETYETQKMHFHEDLADVCIKIEKKVFRCHQVIIASRSEYFKARLSRMTGFLEGKGEFSCTNLPSLEEHDLSTEAFEKIIEYMLVSFSFVLNGFIFCVTVVNISVFPWSFRYTDALKEVDPDQAEELFDAASRYLLFPLKRVVADVLLPHLELASPSELCHWLILSDMYGVLKIREHCLDTIACNFETFADTRAFRALLLTLPPPSGDSSLRTTRPSTPGTGGNSDQGNLLDDLREKWLEAEAAELDKRDESAAQFDRRLEMLMLVAEQEVGEAHDRDT
ncbi:hypothetical protein Taro_043517 [Colocasia esculenta]|uniref:BTB domain-containing protein n=1 Tax=Colocasia esculenta TaxID=4460 RepID=A0A843WZ25_COLES|nr:hypothetical protein [Colocasia esculenta]